MTVCPGHPKDETEPDTVKRVACAELLRQERGLEDLRGGRGVPEGWSPG